MTRDTKEKLMELYESLVEVDVRFYYEDNEITHGEITSLSFNEDDTVNIELDEDENYEIELQDFIENHSKEGMNYHSWENARKFEELLES